MDYTQAKETKKEFASIYFNEENVVAIGIGIFNGVPCIKVNLEKDLPHNMPATFKGMLVKYEVTGRAYFC